MLDADYERAAKVDGRLRALLLPDCTSTPLAGNALVVVDSSRTPCPGCLSRLSIAKPGGTAMLEPLIKKLEHFLPLPDPEKEWLDGLVSRLDEIPAHADIIRQGEIPAGVFVIISGHACCYKILPDGGRQILDFMFVGDMSELHSLLLRAEHWLRAEAEISGKEYLGVTDNGKLIEHASGAADPAPRRRSRSRQLAPADR